MDSSLEDREILACVRGKWDFRKLQGNWCTFEDTHKFLEKYFSIEVQIKKVRARNNFLNKIFIFKNLEIPKFISCDENAIYIRNTINLYQWRHDRDSRLARTYQTVDVPPTSVSFRYQSNVLKFSINRVSLLRFAEFRVRKSVSQLIKGLKDNFVRNRRSFCEHELRTWPIIAKLIKLRK